MHPALWKLLRLRYSANLRRTLGGLKTWKGALTFLCGLMVLCMILGSNVVVLLTTPVRPRPELLRLTAPVFLLAFTLLSLNSTSKLQAIHFWPAEVDFLFAGPFSRRELLYYKMAGSFLGAFFLALLFSTWLVRFAFSWWFVFAGLFLAACFVQLMQVVMVLLIQTLSERGVSVSRKAMLIGLGAVLAWAILRGVAARNGNDFEDYVRAARDTWAGFLLLLPFDVFGRILAAESVYPDFLLWSAVACGLNVLLFAVIIRLDANYLEASVAGSQMVAQRMQRMRSGNYRFDPSEGSVRRRLPLLPRCGGAGTIARRQLIKAARSSMWVPLIMVVTGGGVMLFLVRQMGQQNLVPVLVGASVYCTFIFSSLFPFDFRGDLEQMDLLKQLPMRPTAVAVGQLAAPVLLVSLIQVFLFGIVAVMTMNFVVAGLAALFVLPFNVLLYGIENFTFLVYPVRMAASTPGDFQHFGRQMMMMMAKMFILGMIATIAALGGLVVYLLLGNSLPAAIGFGWCLLSGFAVALLPVIAWAFQRFDVSRGLPG